VLTKRQFVNHIFVSTTESVGPVETMNALAALRTGKDERASSPDVLNHDRQSIARQAIQVSKAHARTTPTYFRLTPTATRVLDAMKQQSPETELHESLRKVTTKQESKKAKAAVDRANRDLKANGVIGVGTIAEFEALSALLLKKVLPVKSIGDDGVRGVLHFGR